MGLIVSAVRAESHSESSAPGEIFPEVSGPRPDDTALQDPPSESQIAPPRLIHSVEAIYPESALERRVEGLVVLELVVNIEGEVEEVRVLEPRDRALDSAAVAAARLFRFEPARRGSTPVAARIRYRYEFRLPDVSEQRQLEEDVQRSAGDQRGKPTTSKPSTSRAIEVTVRGRAQSAYSAPNASTATKTNTPIMQLPQSVQVVTRAVMDDQQAGSLGSVLENVSGVQDRGMDRVGLVELFTARGFPLNPERNFYRDGRPFVFSAPPPVELIERVEFLKGPASVLYGQAEPGGVVNLVLKRPTPRPFVRGTTQIGSYNRYQGVVDAGGPLGKHFGYRATTSYLNSQTFRRFQQINQLVLAGTLSYRPAQWFLLDVRGSYQRRTQRADSGLVAGADVPIEMSLNEPWTRIGLSAGHAEYQATIRLGDNWTIRQASSWQRQGTDELRADPLGVQAAVPSQGIEEGDVARALRDRSTERLSLYAEANLLGKFTTGPLDHQVLVGADVYRSIHGFTENRPIITPPGSFNIYDPVYTPEPPQSLGDSVFRLSRSTFLRFGAYAQDQIDLFRWIHLLGGARIDGFQDTLDQSRFDTQNSTVVDQGQAGATFRGGVLVDPFRINALFLSYAQGFQPNIDPFFNGQLPPETSDQWEFGSKLELFRGALLATITGFHLTKTNVVIVNPVSQVLSIAGERRARGIEVDIVGNLTPEWSLIANYAYLDARVTKGDPRPLGTPGVGTVDITGNVPPSSPDYSGRIWTTYRFDRSSVLAGFRFGIGARARSEVQANLANTAAHPGFVRLDAMIGWKKRWSGCEIDTQLNILNITDQQSFSGTNANFTKSGDPFTVLWNLSFRLDHREGGES